VAEAMGEAVLAEMERNAHVRCDCGSCDGDPLGLTGREAAVLLTEVRRARQAETDLHARLAEIGETRKEWAADGPAGWFQAPDDARSEWSERFARGVVEGAAEQGVKVRLKRRLVGEWHEVPDA